MNAADISALIEAEIAGRWHVSNAHGVELRRCLVSPEKREFATSLGDVTTLWLVLEEDPNIRGGYIVVFDEESGKFGLATADSRRQMDVFLGIYGNFIETLEAM